MDNITKLKIAGGCIAGMALLAICIFASTQLYAI